MRHCLSSSIIAAIFLLHTNLSHSQTRTGAAMAFLDVPQATRLVGAGGMHATTGVSSPTMVFHNPASVADTISGTISLSIAPVTESIKYASAAYTHDVAHIGTFTAGIIYAGYGNFVGADDQGVETGTFTANEGALYLSMSKEMAPWLRLGATFKPIYSKMADYTSFALAMDFGADLTFADGRLKSALVIRNAGAVVKKYTSDATNRPLPIDVKLGFAYKASHAPFRFIVTLKDLTQWDLSVNNKKLSAGDNILRHFLIGIEFTPVKAFYVNMGYDHRRRRELTDANAGGMAGFSWGAGLHVAKIDIQYSHSRYHAAGSLNSITLATNWRKWIK